MQLPDNDSPRVEFMANSPAQRPVRFYSSLSGPLLLDSKFPFSWWPKKGDWRILVCSRWTPGIPRDGYRT